MIAISQSADKFYYLNWIPSESGLVITKYGDIKSNDFDLLKDGHNFNEILGQIIKDVNVDEPVLSLSLDKNNFIFSSSYINKNDSDLFDWYKMKIEDSLLNEKMDFYYYPMEKNSSKLLSISIPKSIRETIKTNMESLYLCLNNLSIGIFSAENGARAWFNADQWKNYVIWKFGNNKQDEILLINGNELSAYFSISRSNGKVSINWQLGENEKIIFLCDYIEKLMNKGTIKNSPFEKIYVYSCDGKIEDIKKFQKKDDKNIVLLNPFSVLNMMQADKVNLYDTLPFAETGNAFRGIDV